MCIQGISAIVLNTGDIGGIALIIFHEEKSNTNSNMSEILLAKEFVVEEPKKTDWQKLQNADKNSSVEKILQNLDLKKFKKIRIRTAKPVQSRST